MEYVYPLKLGPKLPHQFPLKCQFAQPELIKFKFITAPFLYWIHRVLLSKLQVWQCLQLSSPSQRLPTSDVLGHQAEHELPMV